VLSYPATSFPQPFYDPAPYPPAAYAPPVPAPAFAATPGAVPAEPEPDLVPERGPARAFEASRIFRPEPLRSDWDPVPYAPILPVTEPAEPAPAMAPPPPLAAPAAEPQSLLAAYRDALSHSDPERSEAYTQ
jgi:hypothetical protein